MREPGPVFDVKGPLWRGVSVQRCGRPDGRQPDAMVYTHLDAVNDSSQAALRPRPSGRDMSFV